MHPKSSNPPSPIFEFSIQLISSATNTSTQWREMARFETMHCNAFLLCPNFVPPSKLTSINNLDIGRTLSSQSQDYISKYEIFLRKYFHRPERNPFQEIKSNIVQNWQPCGICNSFQASVLLVILSAAHTSYLFLFSLGPSYGWSESISGNGLSNR